jgi:hypothetical protein
MRKGYRISDIECPKSNVEVQTEEKEMGKEYRNVEY